MTKETELFISAHNQICLNLFLSIRIHLVCIQYDNNNAYIIAAHVNMGLLTYESENIYCW